MKYKAIIIDDEAKGRLALKQKLADYCPEIEVVAEADNGLGEDGKTNNARALGAAPDRSITV